MLVTTGLYAALLGLLSLYLGGTVGNLRGKKKIPMGDGGDADIIVANRRHMNFVENVPIALILMALVEINGAPSMWIHFLGLPLLAARIVHPFGIKIDRMTAARGIGAGVTALVILASAGILLWQALVR